MPADISHVQSAIIIRPHVKEILILWRNGVGSFPGGKPEPQDGGSPRKVVCREVFDETGLEVISCDYFGTFQGNGLPKDGIVVVDFHLVGVEGHIRLSSEHQNFDWFNRQTLQWEKMTEPNQQCLRELIQDGLL